MLNTLTPRRALLLIAAVAFVIIAGAWGFEYSGYPPCELCLKQRYAYYLTIPLALALAGLAPSQPGLARAGLYLLLVVWLGNMVFGIWHSGIEWGWWQGPTACTGSGELSALPDLTKPAAMCDKPAIRIFGLSLAGWNAIVSLALAITAFKGARARSA